MSFTNIAIEKLSIPKGYKEVILSSEPLNDAQKKKGFCESADASHYWRHATKSDISLCINEDKGTWHHRIEMATSGDEFDEFEDYIKDWAAKNDKKGDKNFLWAEWFCQNIDADPRMNDSFDINVSAPSGWKAVYISSADFDTYKFLIEVVSSSLKKLSTQKFEQLDNDLKQAAENPAKLDDCTAVIMEKAADLCDYKDIWSRLNAIFEKHGVTNDTLKLLAAACIIPSRSLKKELASLCDTQKIKEALYANGEMSEELFHNLQEALSEYYFSLSSGYPTKGIVKKLAKAAALPLELFGFGIHFEGLKTLIRAFENDAVLSIGIDMYQSDTKYDSDDFGYYDGIENADDSFWAEVNIADMLK